MFWDVLPLNEEEMFVNRTRATIFFTAILLVSLCAPCLAADNERSVEEKQNKTLAAKQLVLKGLSQSLAKNYDKAIETFTAAINLAPDYARAYDFRGDAYMSKGEPDRAIEDYSKAISLNPDYPDYADVYHNRGIAYLKKKKFEKAIEDFNKAISLKPDYGAVYGARGAAYKNLKQIDKASADFKKACSMSIKQGCEELKALK